MERNNVARSDSRAARQGWAVSIVLHAVLITGFSFFQLRAHDPLPEFVDMSWGSPGGSTGTGTAAGIGPMDVTPQALEARAQRSSQKTEEDNVALPVRRGSSMPEEAITMPGSKKNVNPDALPNFAPSNKIAGDDRKAPVTSSAYAGRTDVKAGAAGRSMGAAGGGTDPYGTGSGNGRGGGIGNGFGPGSGDGVSYGIEWSGHGTRMLESGALPVYPSGVNREAQIKLKLVVSPSGSVKSAQPLQKGDTRLENAALKAVRLWKFGALQSGQPSIEQSCIVTFNFRLK